MARLVFYVLLGLEGDAMLVWGGVENRWPALVCGLVVAMGAYVMLATGWWLKWERTAVPDLYYGLCVDTRTGEQGMTWGPSPEVTTTVAFEDQVMVLDSCPVPYEGAGPMPVTRPEPL